ncbi:MAG TPA: hypothetical protein VGB51_09890 [Actinomycetota bacterium]
MREEIPLPAARRTIAVLALLLCTPLSARAGAVPALEERALVESRIAPARATVQRLRDTLARGGLGAAIRAGAIAAERLDAVEGLPAPGPAPRTLAEAAASIAAASRMAQRIVRHGPAASLPSWVERTAFEVAVRGGGDPGVFRGVAAVDPAPALRAAALISRAVDRAMPALARAAERAPRRAAAAVECDLVSQPGVCVGGLGANTYVQEGMVHIDLGGDDTYLTDAGLASLGVDLYVDLTGDDRYLAPLGGYGYGSVGGVGILFDAAGNDLYRSESTTSVLGGMGLGLVGGAGFMVDGAGNDTYTFVSEVTGGAAGAGGLGESVLGGVGVMVDGNGNDTYSATGIAHPVRETVFPEDPEEQPYDVTNAGSAAVSIGGIGVFAGASVFADGGGTDSFTAHSRITAAPSDWPPVQVTADDVGSVQQYGLVNGFGDAALAGAGYFLEGAGTTTYTQRSVIESLPIEDQRVYMNHVGMGEGATGATGVLSDAGGNDTYSVELSGTSAISSRVDDACTQPCLPSSPNPVAPPVTATSQGWGAFGGIGLLDDGGGNDIYRMTLSDSVSATGEDLRTAPADETIVGSASTQGAALAGQGAGTAEGAGVLADALGDDRYETTITSRASVAATSTLPANRPDVQATPGTPTALAQGLGQGAGGIGGLLDLGGADAYSASAASSTTTDGGPPVPASVVLKAQAAADAGATALGLAFDLDGISADTYTTVPAYPACTGTRGQGHWRDCGTHGVGFNG